MRPSLLSTIDKKGFTIIEVAIVMVIIGLLVGFGATLVGPLTERSKRMATTEIIMGAMESIVGFAATEKRLPQWGDNIVDTDLDEFCEVVSKRKDSASLPLYYFFDTRLTAPDSVCGRKTTALTVCRDSNCTDRILNIAFAVISGAMDYNPQTGIVTAGCPAGQTCIGVYEPGSANIDNCTNTTNCPNFDEAVTRISRPEAYDDIVEYITLNELRTKVDCQGPQLKILNNELAPGSMSSPYSAMIYVEGGIPFPSSGDFKWCVEIRNRDAADGVPGGLSITPNFVRYPNDTSPTFCSDQPETTWSSAQADNLSISSASALTETGNFLFTVVVRDNSNAGNDTACNSPNNLDNCVSKSFVLTINP
jgi:prepilin-type N-terminal cleavage/methylation domain-containing protein